MPAATACEEPSNAVGKDNNLIHSKDPYWAFWKPDIDIGGGLRVFSSLLAGTICLALGSVPTEAAEPSPGDVIGAYNPWQSYSNLGGAEYGFTQIGVSGSTITGLTGEGDLYQITFNAAFSPTSDWKQFSCNDGRKFIAVSTADLSAVDENGKIVDIKTPICPSIQQVDTSMKLTRFDGGPMRATAIDENGSAYVNAGSLWMKIPAFEGMDAKQVYSPIYGNSINPLFAIGKDGASRYVQFELGAWSNTTDLEAEAPLVSMASDTAVHMYASDMNGNIEFMDPNYGNISAGKWANITTLRASPWPKVQYLTGHQSQLFAIAGTPKNTTDTPPAITAPDMTIDEQTQFNPMDGVTATDKEDGDITNKVTYTGTVDVTTPDKYELTYSVTDSGGNTVTATRTITVVASATPPTTIACAPQTGDRAASVWQMTTFLCGMLMIGLGVLVLRLRRLEHR